LEFWANFVSDTKINPCFSINDVETSICEIFSNCLNNLVIYHILYGSVCISHTSVNKSGKGPNLRKLLYFFSRFFSSFTHTIGGKSIFPAHEVKNNKGGLIKEYLGTTTSDAKKN
jgi:hypothetical protein